MLSNFRKEVPSMDWKRIGYLITMAALFIVECVLALIH